MLLTLALSILIGVLLGLLGGGGSILTVPMLVYVLHVEPKTAILTSFVVVGISSLMAMIPHARRGHVCWKSAVFFGLAGMAGAFGGGRLAGFFSGDVLMALFGSICLLTGVAMMAKPRAVVKVERPMLSLCPLQLPYLRLLFDGLLVGALTGLVGVGGGFLIVPVLTLLVGLSMPAAIGTSLLVISINAIAGLSGYANHVALDVPLTAIVAAGAVSGSLLGAGLSGYLRPAVLRRSFGGFVILVAVYVLSQALTIQLWLEVENLVSPGWLLAGLLGLALIGWFGGWVHRRHFGLAEQTHHPMPPG